MYKVNIPDLYYVIGSACDECNLCKVMSAIMHCCVEFSRDTARGRTLLEPAGATAEAPATPAG